MSHDSNITDKNSVQEPSVEPPSEMPHPDATAATADSEVTGTSSVSVPPAPEDAPSTGTSDATVNSLATNGLSASQGPAPETTGTAPADPSNAPVPLPPAQVQQYQYQQPQQPPPPMQVKARNPMLYAVLDFLITDLGLMVQGRVAFGILFLGINTVASLLLLIPFLGWVLFFLVLLPVWIISMVMAFTTAKRWNRQHGIIS